MGLNRLKRSTQLQNPVEECAGSRSVLREDGTNDRGSFDGLANLLRYLRCKSRQREEEKCQASHDSKFPRPSLNRNRKRQCRQEGQCSPPLKNQDWNTQQDD